MAGNTVAIRKDVEGKPGPQYYNPITDTYEFLEGSGGANNVKVINSSLPTGAATEAKQDTIISATGATTDAEAAGNGGIIGILKRLRTLLAAGLPAALTAGGGVKAGLVDALPTGTNTIGSVKAAGNDTMLQGNIALTGAAQQVNANTPCRVVTIQAEPTNQGYVYVGLNTVSSTVHMCTLSPGSSMTITCSNLNLLYVLGTSGDKVCYGGEA